MKTHAYRVRFSIKGGHVHCRLFSKPNGPGDTWAKCGDLTFSVDEWSAFKSSFAAQFMDEPT